MWGITFVSISSELNLTRIYSELNLKHIDACDILYHVVVRALKVIKDFHELKAEEVTGLKLIGFERWEISLYKSYAVAKVKNNWFICMNYVMKE